MWIQLGILAACTWILPFCMGALPVRFMKEEHKSLGMIWVSGWLLMFAVFQLLVVPFIVLEASFLLAIRCYTIVIGILSLISLLAGRNAFADSILKWRGKKFEKGQFPIMVTVLLLVGFQLVAAFYMQYLDGDDSFYVAASLTSQLTDSMYLHTPYYGAAGPLDTRHALAPTPMFFAWLSEVSGIHVTIICHSYIGILFLGLMYVIYMQLAGSLFPGQRKNRWLFLLFINIWYLFGNASIYAAESFAYTRTWQGKSMFPNLIVPVLFLWMFFLAKEEMDIGEWAMLFVLTLSATFTTSTGVFTVPLLLGLAAVVMAFHKKKPVILAQTGACLVPSLFYGMLYLFLT